MRGKGGWARGRGRGERVGGGRGRAGGRRGIRSPTYYTSTNYTIHAQNTVAHMHKQTVAHMPVHSTHMYTHS